MNLGNNAAAAASDSIGTAAGIGAIAGGAAAEAGVAGVAVVAVVAGQVVAVMVVETAAMRQQWTPARKRRWF